LGGFGKLCLALILGLLVVGAGILQPAFAQAQGSPSPELKKQYDEAFDETLKKPDDLDVLFKYAGLANQMGDYEGAISALERMLLINPDLPRVRLELGVLYFKLGSYEAARTYLETALNSPSLPPDVRAKAQEYLAAAISKSSPSTLTGEMFLGWRYQSNANLGPSTSRVLLFGQAANLNQQATGQPDWSTVGSLQVRHRYDFGNQDKGALETQFTAYGNGQFQQWPANVILLDLTSGPRFQVFADTYEDFTLKPFATVGYVFVANTTYYFSWGAGVESNLLLANGLRNISVGVVRRQNNQDNDYLPTNSQYRGNSMTANTAFQYELAPTIMLFATGTAQRFDADLTAAQSYWLYGVGAGMAFRFEDPLFKSGLPWSINFSASEQWWSYDQPDPVVDPTTLRYQNDTILNIVLTVPFDERTTFSLSGGRFVRGATVSNYGFENNSFMFGISWRF
jgi:hypothetical protein